MTGIILLTQYFMPSFIDFPQLKKTLKDNREIVGFKVEICPDILLKT